MTFNKSLGYSFLTKGALVFVITFILFLPNSYYLFPDIGSTLKFIPESFGRLILNDPSRYYQPDGEIMLIWITLLFVFSILIAFIWSKLRPLYTVNLYWLTTISAYYLALTLFIYGFNKIFNYQFYFPEPNTLYTPLGQLSPDILYWSSMGTSYSYSLFAGLIELLPATLLLFKRTRLIGGLISFAVLTNIAMLNIGFNITVKTYTFFLLLLSLIICLPHFERLRAFFISYKETPVYSTPKPPTFIRKIKKGIKPIIIALLLIESLGMYVSSGVFNGDDFPKPAHFGAYSAVNNHDNVKHVFFHSKGYFIIQTNDDNFIDYPYQLNGKTLVLTDYNKEQTLLKFIYKHPTQLEISGNFFGKEIYWKFIKITLTDLPIYGN